MLRSNKLWNDFYYEIGILCIWVFDANVVSVARRQELVVVCSSFDLLVTQKAVPTTSIAPPAYKLGEGNGGIRQHSGDTLRRPVGQRSSINAKKYLIDRINIRKSGGVISHRPTPKKYCRIETSTSKENPSAALKRLIYILIAVYILY